MHRVEAGHLEDVDHVVHVELGQVKRRDRPRQIVVAGDIEVTVVEQLVQVGIASSAEQVVAASTGSRGLRRDAVVGDGHHRTQVGETGPQPVERRHVSSLQLSGA